MRQPRVLDGLGAVGDRLRLVACLGVLLLATLGATGGSCNPALPPPVACPSCYRPPPETSWQWQLTTPVDLSVEAAIYDIDLFDNDAAVVAELHTAGRKAICYVSAGSAENWRPDYGAFPASVLGRPLDGWPGERWLDVRQLDVLGPILEARLDLCAAKGFDGVELDNVDGWENATGFPLSSADQIQYNAFLANAAHIRGLSVALKNDLGQVSALLPYFDWALVEECFRYSECEKTRPFLDAGKAVMEVEYVLDPAVFCPQASALGLNAMRKHLALDAYRIPCS